MPQFIENGKLTKIGEWVHYLISTTPENDVKTERYEMAMSVMNTYTKNDPMFSSNSFGKDIELTLRKYQK